MTVYEYKVIPAPNRGEKAKGVKSPEARFAFALQRLMNQLAKDGWEFLRSETLPSEERSGLTQTVTHWRSLLVFRRPLAGDAATDDDDMEDPVETGAPHVPFVHGRHSADVSSLDDIKRARAELLSED